MIRVDWIQTALNEAANLWMSADSKLRQELNDAMNLIDQRLETNPTQEGESRPNNRRILFEFPLGVLFRIESSGDVVSVLHVWHCPKRKKSP